jgi:hypothetical protein
MSPASASSLLGLRFETEDGGDILTKLQTFTKLHDITTQTTTILKYFTHLLLINFVNQIFLCCFHDEFPEPREFSTKRISEDGN